MKTLFAALSLCLACAPAFAGATIEKDGKKYTSYSISSENGQAVTVKVKMTLKTREACNRYQLEGTFYQSNNDGDVSQILVGKFGATGTMMACQDRTQKTLNLESENFVIQPVQGTVSAEVLLPEDMELVIVK